MIDKKVGMTTVDTNNQFISLKRSLFTIIFTGRFITSKTEDGTIMSIAHKHYDVKGIQFHPESYITQSGIRMMRNWLLL